MVCTKETVKEEGLNIWVDNSGPDSQPEVDIIAVQGLGSNPYYTWVGKAKNANQSTSKAPRKSSKALSPENDSGVMWLKDLLPSKIKNARIATYSYKSEWFRPGKGVKTCLRECGQQLLNCLDIERLATNERKRPIIFIAHSMGGLVVKQALVLANLGDKYRDIKLSTVGILFLGTPHAGSDAATKGKWIAAIAGNDTTLLESLKSGSSELFYLADDFSAASKSLTIVSYYERNKSTYVGGLQKVEVVSAPSATILGERTIYLDCDHSGLNKYAGPDDPNFALVYPWIQEMARISHGFVNRNYGDHKIFQQFLELREPLSFQDKQDLAFFKRAPETGGWIFEKSSPFKQWLEGKENSAIWCSGIPGSGKTVIASTIINHLKTHSSYKGDGIAYVYCDYKFQAKQTAENLVWSLTYQLAKQCDDMPQDTRTIYQRCGKSPSWNDYKSLLLSITRAFPRTFVVVDALDECHELDAPDGKDLKFLSALQSLRSGSSVRLLVTSRPHKVIQQNFKNLSQVDIVPRQSDINASLEFRINSNPKFANRIAKGKDLKGEIVRAILENYGGVFLLATMQVDYLELQTNVRDIRKALSKLPTTLEEVYRNSIKRIQEGPYKELALQALAWISRAKRSLYLEELRHALAVEHGDTFFNEEGLTDEDTILAACAGLVLIDENIKLIRLVHSTLQKHLETFQQELFPCAEIEISRACLTYMSYDIFEKGPCDSNEALFDRLREYPFLEYATLHGADHMRGDLEKTLQEEIQEFLEDEPKATCAMQVHSFLIHNRKSAHDAFPKELNSLHLAAYWGLSWVIGLLLDSGSDISSYGPDGWTALHWAASNGHEAAVGLLLDKNANTEAQDTNHKWTPLHWAVFKGHESVVKELLKRRANLAAQDLGGRTPLHWATSNGDEAMVKLLLQGGKGLYIGVKDNAGRTALQEALRNDDRGVAQLLLKKSAALVDHGYKGSHTGELDLDDESQDLEILRSLLHKGGFMYHNGRNLPSRLFHTAAKRGDEPLARLLLDGWVKDTDREYRTTLSVALFLAAKNGHEEVVKLLLEKGADATLPAVGDHRRGLLHWAALGRNEVVVRLLQNKGASAEEALGTAVNEGHVAVVRLLLKTGVDVDAKIGWNRETALHSAAKNGNAAVAMLLLEKTIDVEPENEESGQTPLCLAAEHGHEKIVELLLNKGADINHRDAQYGLTPLSWAVMNGHDKIVELLLKKEADVNAQGYGRNTPLTWAIEVGSLSLCQLLLAKCAKLNYGYCVLRLQGRRMSQEKFKRGGTVSFSTDEELERKKDHYLYGEGFGREWTFGGELRGWRTPLTRAVKIGDLSIVELLLSHPNIDVNFKDNENDRTALSWAATDGHVDIVNVLLAAGAAPDANDRLYRTPLSYAAESGHDAVMRQLLGTNKVIPDSKAAGDCEGRTPLSWAAENGHDVIVELLVTEYGANPDSKDKRNWTPLFYAINYGHEAVVKLLLATGRVDPDTSDQDGRTPLLLAADKGHNVIVEMLLETEGVNPDSKDKNGRTPCFHAAEGGQKHILELLLASDRVDPDSTDNDNCTALCKAAEKGYGDIIGILLATNRVNPDIRNKDGQTPLWIAVKNNRLAAVKMLLDTKKVNSDVKDNNNWTPLLKASAGGYNEIVELLLASGPVDVDYKNNDGQTPLLLALKGEHWKTLQLLLESKASVNTHEREYWAMVQVAAYHGCTPLIQLLTAMEGGSGANGVNLEEVLQIACTQGHKDVVDQLLRLGADPNGADEHEWTPMLCASWFRRPQILETLASYGGQKDLLLQINTTKPSSWSNSDKSANLELDDDLLGVRYKEFNYDKGNEKPLGALILADHPVPLQDDGFYFEIEILSYDGKNDSIWLGICARHSSLNSLATWNKSASWGFNGYYKCHGGSGHGYSRFKAGDIVGCKVRLKQDLLFTNNGKSLGVAFRETFGKVYPAVCLGRPGTHIRANFGQRPFVYNVDDTSGHDW